MFEITIGGRKIRPEDIEEKLKKAAAKQIGEELQARISSIRCSAVATSLNDKSNTTSHSRTRLLPSILR